DTDKQKSAYKWWLRSFEDDVSPIPFEVKPIAGDDPANFLSTVVGLNKTKKDESGRYYDYLIIDTPPNPENAGMNAALYASDLVVTPVTPDILHLDALEELFDLFDHANSLRLEKGRPPLKVRIVATRAYEERASNQELLQYLNEVLTAWRQHRNLDIQLLRAVIKQRAAFVNATNIRHTIFTAPGCTEVRNMMMTVIEELS